MAKASKSKIIEKYVDALTEAKQAKDFAYWERNQLVVVLSKLFPAHLTKHPNDDMLWEKEWMNIVCIHLPTGQATWHIHDSDLKDFTHLKYDENHWDGHSTKEKYERLSKIEGVKL